MCCNNKSLSEFLGWRSMNLTFRAHCSFALIRRRPLLLCMSAYSLNGQRDDDRFFSRAQGKLCGQLLFVDRRWSRHHRSPLSWAHESRWWFVNWYTASGYRFPFSCIGCVTITFFCCCCCFPSFFSISSGSIARTHIKFYLVPGLSSRIHSLCRSSEIDLLFLLHLLCSLVKWVKAHIRSLARVRVYLSYIFIFDFIKEKYLFPRSWLGRGLCWMWCTYRIHALARARAMWHVFLFKKTVGFVCCFFWLLRNVSVCVRVPAFIDHGLHWLTHTNNAIVKLVWIRWTTDEPRVK